MAKTTLALMSECSVAPTPDNYELFFTYATGGNLALGKAMDALVSARSPFTSAVLEGLRSRAVSATRTTQALENTSVSVSEILKAATEKLQEAGRDAGDYGRTLSQAIGALDGEKSREELRVFIDRLVGETRKMEARTKTLEQELHQSSQQVDRLKTQLDNVRKESLTDGLTGVANRKAFDAQIVKAITEAREAGEPLALLICDIDHFKRVNDSWGHQTGDRVLQLVAQGLSENLKGRDTVARFGGEEFAVILRQTSLTNAITHANLLRRFVQNKKLVKKSTGDILGTITVSIGVAALNEGDTTTSLIQRADACLYRAKNTGRNRVVSQNDPAVAESNVA